MADRVASAERRLAAEQTTEHVTGPGSSTPAVGARDPEVAAAGQLVGRVGNRALARYVAARQAGRALAREVRQIRGERVHVRNDAEATEAETIIDTIENTYQIDVNSLGTARGVRWRFRTALAAVRSQISRRGWRMRELRALLRACGHFAPILGAARATSSRGGRRQEATRVGAVTGGPDEAETAIDPELLGEFFRSQRSFALFRPFLSDTSTLGDLDRDMEFTATHELSHGLMHYALPSFIRNTPFWLDRNTESGVAGAEEPPTDYGHDNAEEDMCEAVAMYFVAPRRLRRDAPERYRWVRRKVREWTAGAGAAAPPAPAVAPGAPVAPAGSSGGHGPVPVPAGVGGG